MRTRHLVVGPDGHGVTRHALAVCAAGGFPVVRVPRPVGPEDLDLLLGLTAGEAPVHLHVTDRLLGAGPEQAAALVADLGAHRRLSATLHDLPDPGDGPLNAPRRAAAYAAIARACAPVLVASDHEAALLDRAAGHPVGAVVVPLPVDPVAVHDADGPPSPDVAVLGWVYPGKGHAQVLDALTVLPPEVGLLVLGAASPGHHDVVTGLLGTGARLGRRVDVTGWVPDDELTRRLRRVAVPVAAHQRVSASGSVGSWLTAGRRPLVARTPWARELDARLPGAVVLYDDLAAALAQAWADPASTWATGSGPVLGPSTVEVAQRYAEVLP